MNELIGVKCFYCDEDARDRFFRDKYRTNAVAGEQKRGLV